MASDNEIKSILEKNRFVTSSTPVFKFISIFIGGMILIIALTSYFKDEKKVDEDKNKPPSILGIEEENTIYKEGETYDSIMNLK